jgi:hypothetical protein
LIWVAGPVGGETIGARHDYPAELTVNSAFSHSLGHIRTFGSSISFPTE